MPHMARETVDRAIAAVFPILLGTFVAALVILIEEG